MEKENLKQIILDQNLIYSIPNNFTYRELYSKLENIKTNNQIIILTGIRRCGKSTLLQYIRNQSKDKNYYLNFDDDRLQNFQIEDFQQLLECFIELYGEETTFYFDEIQNVEGWEKFVIRLYDNKKKVYITGSNASMLSKELGTHLTGRYIGIELYPFSFKEFLSFKKVDFNINKKNFNTLEKAQINQLFDEFVETGGFPEYLFNQNREFFHFLYNDILYRDIMVRYKITKEKSIKELGFYLASNIGQEISYNKLKNMLGLGSSNTVMEYCNYLENSFLSFFINKYDYSLKKQIYSNKKHYFIDQALVKNIGFTSSENKGSILENIVFIELKRRGADIYFHKDKKECDFLIRQGYKIKEAIQVSLYLNDDKTYKREMDGLMEALQKYELDTGIIITRELEKEEIINNKTIKIIPIWKYLLDWTNL